MSDAELREAERHWKQTGTAEAERHWLSLQLKAGSLDDDDLRVRAILGSPGAQLLVDPVVVTRWQPLVRLFADWHVEPLQPAGHSTKAAIHTAEKRLGTPLPQALREWFLLVGDRIGRSESYEFLRPDQLELRSDLVVAIRDADSELFAGALTNGELTDPDPSGFVEYPSSPLPRQVYPRLSQLLCALAYTDTVVGGFVLQSAFGRLPEHLEYGHCLEPRTVAETVGRFPPLFEGPTGEQGPMDHLQGDSNTILAFNGLLDFSALARTPHAWTEINRLVLRRTDWAHRNH